MRLDRDTTLQAAQLIANGATAIEVARGWDISASTLYTAFSRYEIKLERNTTSPAEHVALQQASLTPPEVYAHRAGIAFPTLRRYAWELGETLAINTYAERKAFWEAKFDGFDPGNCRAFCTLNDIPVPMVAHWYHKLHNPSQQLLWGFTQLLTVTTDQFCDITRYKDPEATLHALGKGKTVVPIGIRLANEVFHASEYQHC